MTNPSEPGQQSNLAIAHETSREVKAAAVPGRATLISRALKDAAVRTRGGGMFWSAPHSSDRRFHRVLAPLLFISFFVLVAVPAVLWAGYLAFWASDQFAVEMKFAVRNGASSITGLGGSVGGLVSAQQMQDTLIIYEYVHSQQIVDELDSKLNLREIFARPGVDYFSKVDPSVSIEKLAEYWRRRIDVDLDSSSGIITITARAFTPQDALLIANGIIDSCERLVNDLMERARRNDLHQAEAELKFAESNLNERSARLEQLRNAEGIIDADKSADALTKMSTALRLDLIRSEQEYAQQGRSVSSDAPQMKVLKNRIEAIRRQYKKLSEEIASPHNQSASMLSAAMNRFERETVDRDIAQQQYLRAASALERARMATLVRPVNLVNFLPPALPEYALFPRRWWLWFVVVSLFMAAWAAIVGILVLVRNHVAV